VLRLGHGLLGLTHDTAGLAPSTRVVIAGRPARVPDAPLNPPIVPASSFIAGGALEYAREDAPSTHALESAISDLEGGRTLVFSSGMAAANSVLDQVPIGGIVVAPDPCYTGVSARLTELHAAGRLQVRRVDITDTTEVAAACQGAALLWLESPTNPLLEVADLPACIAAGSKAGAKTLVDNTFATPLLQQPLTMGADYVLHSVTKALSGHSDLLMGAIVCRSDEDAHTVQTRRVLLGAAPSAFDCYLALRGLRTLVVRMDRACATAALLAERLGAHPAITRLRYPGFGAMLAIELADSTAADALCANTRIWVHATSLGGVESLLERRRRWPLESARVPEELVRLSVGIEDAEDLWSDLEMALVR